MNYYILNERFYSLIKTCEEALLLFMAAFDFPDWPFWAHCSTFVNSLSSFFDRAEQFGSCIFSLCLAKSHPKSNLSWQGSTWLRCETLNTSNWCRRCQSRTRSCLDWSHGRFWMPCCPIFACRQLFRIVSFFCYSRGSAPSTFLHFHRSLPRCCTLRRSVPVRQCLVFPIALARHWDVSTWCGESESEMEGYLGFVEKDYLPAAHLWSFLVNDSSSCRSVLLFGTIHCPWSSRIVGMQSVRPVCSSWSKFCGRFRQRQSCCRRSRWWWRSGAGCGS